MSANWKASLTDVLRTRNRVRSGGSVASFATQEKRGRDLFTGFAELRRLGYKFDDVQSFRGRHMQALVQEWERRGLTPATMQNKISVFRTFAGWIGKAGMVEGSEKYVSDPKLVRRSSVNKVDRSWQAHGLDVTTTIARVRDVDVRVACQLELQRIFKLRPLESILLKPHLADHGHTLMVAYGTKGGRERVVDINTSEQRNVLEQAKTFAATKNSSMADPNLSLKQAKRRFYRVLEGCGLTKKQSGATAYGLRHGGAGDRYEEVTGERAPVRGGGPVDPELDKYARQIIAEELGHSRSHITTHYIGRNKN